LFASLHVERLMGKVRHVFTTTHSIIEIERKTRNSH